MTVVGHIGQLCVVVLLLLLLLPLLYRYITSIVSLAFSPFVVLGSAINSFVSWMVPPGNGGANIPRCRHHPQNSTPQNPCPSGGNAAFQTLLYLVQ